MSKYLITGGAGFIGSALARKLIENNHSVVILDNLSTGTTDNIPNGCDSIFTDNILNRELVDKLVSKVDGVFHLAAIASVVKCNARWIDSTDVNLGGTINVLTAAAKYNRQVVYASSAAVYGASEVKIREFHLKMPINIYGTDKYSSELYCRMISELHDIPVTCLRLFNVYGKGQSKDSMYSGVITIFADAIREDRAITIHGDGEQVRDFIHIDHVVEYFIRAMGAGHGYRVFNVCSGVGITIDELAHTAMEAFDTKVEVKRRPERNGDIEKSVGYNDSIVKTLGKIPHIDFNKSIKEIL